MAGVVSDIIIGSSELYIAPAGTALPTLTGAATDFAAFDQPGFTQDGVEWDYSPSYKDHMVDERLGPVKKTITTHKLIASCKLAQATLQNMSYAIPASTFNGTDILTIGSPEEAPEYIIGWRGPAPSGGTRQVLVWRVVQIAATKAHYQRKDMVIFNVQFEALSDSTQAVAQDLAYKQDFPNVPFVLAV